MSEVKVARNLTCDGVAERNGDIFLFEVKSYDYRYITDALKRSIERLSKVLKKSDYKEKHIVLILVTKVELKVEDINVLQEKLNCDDLELTIVNYKINDILK